MKKEKKSKEKEGIVYIPLHKKIWYSISKFERYPEMATEGVGRAFGYLTFIMFIFALIFAIAISIRLNGIIKEGSKSVKKEFQEIEYKDGTLRIVSESKDFNTEIGHLIIDTEQNDEGQIEKYMETSKSNNLEIIWLNDRVIVKLSETVREIKYEDIFNQFGIKEFNKQDVINFIQQQINNPKIYIVYGLIIGIYTFIAYYLATLMDVLVLSLFGMIATYISKMQIRYRAIFNMSVYAYTISILLRLIYLIINLFTNFEIKYFDIMYTTVAFIALVASIFMIKSDVIKQQMELMKVIEIKKKEEENVEEEKEKDKEEKEEKDNKDSNEERKDEEKEKKDKEDSLGTQGGEA